MAYRHALVLLFCSCCAHSAVGTSPDACSDKDESCSSDESALLVSRIGVERRSSKIQVEQDHSKQLGSKMHEVAMSMPQGSTSKSLFESFKICGQCEKFERFGEAHDGGYLMCMDGLHQQAPVAAYSLGVEHHDKWSRDVTSKLGVKVNQFDCTVSGSDCTSCQFFKKCIVSADGLHPVPGHEAEGWSLTQAMSETTHKEWTSIADGSLLMKMDIESSEWPIYASESPDVLKKFGELIVEFHQLQDESRHAEYLKAMQHILASGFKVAHLHGNNWAGMYEAGSASIPQVVEVTFVHGAARPGGCSADQEYDKLDAPNHDGVVELPMSHLE